MSVKPEQVTFASGTEYDESKNHNFGNENNLPGGRLSLCADVCGVTVPLGGGKSL